MLPYVYEAMFYCPENGILMIIIGRGICCVTQFLVGKKNKTENTLAKVRREFPKGYQLMESLGETDYHHLRPCSQVPDSLCH